MQNQFRVDTLGLSAKSRGQLERLIDDATWLSYPLHLAVGVLKTLLFILLLIGAVMLYVGEWMLTAHDDRADLIQNFNREQTIYRFNSADGAVTVAKAGDPVDKDTFDSVFKGCAGSDSQLKHTTWWDHDWLAEKSDLFQGAFLRASYNIAALRSTLGQVRGGGDISFRYACLDAAIYGQGVKIPNAPVVNVAFLHRTDRELESPANALYNHFTGLCLASANCTGTDYLPRNDNIYADAISPQVTPNQAAALKALVDTGSPEFWIATAHANGIYDEDDLIARYARRNQEQLVNDILRHAPTPEEEFQREAEIAIVCCLIFFAGIGFWIARRTAKSCHPRRTSD
jgi:hypothetical protein